MITDISQTEYKTVLRGRTELSHKGTFGTAGLVCGSKCYQGAAYFATKAALRTGAGIVASFVPACVYDVLAVKINGAVLEALDEKDGEVSDSLVADKVVKRKCTALLCGSGIGLSEGAKNTVLALSKLSLPIVFDGDALTHLSQNTAALRRDCPTVITPHTGEFARLTGISVSSLCENKEQILSDFAQHYGCVTVLKDSTTLIGDINGDIYRFSNPTSALSKGGSGDVLAGMTVSFLAQGFTALAAAKTAVTLHNACGHICAQKYGVHYTQPDELLESLPLLLSSL